MTTQVITEVFEVLGRTPQAPPPTPPTDPVEIRSCLTGAREALARAGAGLRVVHEDARAKGISGSDAVKAEELVREVDKLLESLDSYY